MNNESHATDIESGQRFSFGDNWAAFLSVLDDERVIEAETSLKRMLGVTDLRGRRFLDAGSGSGLFSLAARRMGATVHSFDYDPQSVSCTKQLRQRFFKDDPQWTIDTASVLDSAYLGTLGQFDVVYSWGVLHHTGQMWPALDRVSTLVAPGGHLFVAIYNDQGWISRYWTVVKKAYVRYRLLRWPLLVLHTPDQFLARWFVRLLSGRHRVDRGMTLWYDMIDWVGGYPFEVARPEEILRFYRKRGFALHEMITCGGRHGCNEFVFVRQ